MDIYSPSRNSLAAPVAWWDVGGPWISEGRKERGLQMVREGALVFAVYYVEEMEEEEEGDATGEGMEEEEGMEEDVSLLHLI